MSVRVSLLGGVGEFGRNCMVIDDEGLGASLVVDCGIKIADRPLGTADDRDERPARDVLLPDLDALEARKDRVAGYALTHGHDDHIGALPDAMARCPAPIYGTGYTRRRVRQRFQRAGRSAPELMKADVGSSRKIGPFEVTWTAVSHSIPDSAALLIRTSEGLVVHSGDFRVDEAPVLGPPTDLEALRRAGEEGVALLCADSTGATLEGDNPGEASVLPGLAAAFEGVSGRVVVATFSTQIQRLSLVAQLCREHGRRLILVGRGMRDAVNAAQAIGVVHLEDVLQPEGDLWAVPPSRLCLAATGSQGEPLSALWRLSRGSHARVTLGLGDRVILSARTIPGNEEAVSAICTLLEEAGVEVLDGQEGRHVSGHGHAGDLEKLTAALQPRAFLALHGEERHLAACREVGGRHGATVVTARNGDVVRLEGGVASVESR